MWANNQIKLEFGLSHIFSFASLFSTVKINESKQQFIVVSATIEVCAK